MKFALFGFFFFPLGCRGFAPCDKERPPTYCTWSDLTESEEGRQTGQRRGASGTAELWEAAQYIAERQRERGAGVGVVRPCGPTRTHMTDGAPVATEIAPSLERPLPIGMMMLGDVYCNTRLESRVY